MFTMRFFKYNKNIYTEYLRGFNEYDNFLTKFDKRTARIITGNPTSWTGSSNIGSCANDFFGVSTMHTAKSSSPERDGKTFISNFILSLFQLIQ